jgi:hypothetical protein
VRPSRIALAFQSQNVSDSLEPYVLPIGYCTILLTYNRSKYTGQDTVGSCLWLGQTSASL